VTAEGRVALPDVRELLFADLPPLTAIERFAAVPSMHALAQAVAREDTEAARTAFEPLAASPETRVRLQAWTLARRAGIEPPAGPARLARGVVVDVGLDGGTDTLAGYDDGSARYLNQGGGAVVWDARDATIDAAVRALVDAGQAVADASGPLDGPRPPAPGPGGGAIWILTENGIHLGMGPFGALAADRIGGPVIGAATELMRLLIERSQGEASR
jgi:hypothetical protein